MENFGQTLSYLRKRAKVTQLELAKALNIAKSTISMYETGKREPDFETLEAIADFFNVNMDFLIGRKKIDNIVPIPKMSQVPVVGTIAAGMPILAEENVEGYDYAEVPEDQGYFYLRVKGDSMIGAHILNGSLALIKPQACADDGQIVACLVNGDEATLKRFYRQGDMVILKPENPAFSPIIVPCRDFETGYAKILGIVTEVKFKM